MVCRTFAGCEFDLSILVFLYKIVIKLMLFCVKLHVDPILLLTAGNHDTHRPATRFGRVFLDCLHFIQFLLPGTCITYNGDEFAMEDTYVRWSETLDPQAIGAGIDRFEVSLKYVDSK